MRCLALLATALVACSAPPRSTLPTPAPAPVPARDLADAGAAAARGTGRAPALATSDPRVVDLDIIRITARAPAPGADPELTSIASADLFKQANEAAKSSRQRDAIAAYRQLVAEFPESRFAPVALFNIAAVHDSQGDLTATIATLTELVANYPTSRESIDGHLYIAALQTDHHQWAIAATTLAAVLARPGLAFSDRIEAFARQGYVELEQHRYDAADAALSAAIAAWRAAPRIADPYYIAMAHYYRGELMHRRFLEAPVRPGDDDMVADLEAKRVLAGKAYDRWRDSLGFKQAYWATASGYQMSQIFVELWEAHVKAPYPHRIDVATRPAYVVEVHARVRPDLEKALEGHRMNVELAKAYGITTPWSEASAQQAVTIMELLASDAAGRLTVPPD